MKMTKLAEMKSYHVIIPTLNFKSHVKFYSATNPNLSCNSKCIKDIT
ncbi:unnamed protein product [Brugia timori]|uniref:Uncharacterized protein n=1 Tax=Brugia timori TaxID=42155 RepID=A0A0R3RD68_9BILA|nr:unnamed protein product [Brugia timori]